MKDPCINISNELSILYDVIPKIATLHNELFKKGISSGLDHIELVLKELVTISKNLEKRYGKYDNVAFEDANAKASD